MKIILISCTAFPPQLGPNLGKHAAKIPEILPIPDSCPQLCFYFFGYTQYNILYASPYDL
jgi:hypothetical protein